MSTSVAEAATALVEPVAIGVTGQDDMMHTTFLQMKNFILNALIMTRSQLREMSNVSK